MKPRHGSLAFRLMALPIGGSFVVATRTQAVSAHNRALAAGVIVCSAKLPEGLGWQITRLEVRPAKVPKPVKPRRPRARLAAECAILAAIERLPSFTALDIRAAIVPLFPAKPIQSLSATVWWAMNRARCSGLIRLIQPGSGPFPAVYGRMFR